MRFLREQLEQLAKDSTFTLLWKAALFFLGPLAVGTLALLSKWGPLGAALTVFGVFVGLVVLAAHLPRAGERLSLTKGTIFAVLGFLALLAAANRVASLMTEFEDLRARPTQAQLNAKADTLKSVKAVSATQDTTIAALRLALDLRGRQQGVYDDLSQLYREGAKYWSHCDANAAPGEAGSLRMRKTITGWKNRVRAKVGKLGQPALLQFDNSIQNNDWEGTPSNPWSCEGRPQAVCEAIQRIIQTGTGFGGPF